MFTIDVDRALILIFLIVFINKAEESTLDYWLMKKIVYEKDKVMEYRKMVFNNLIEEITKVLNTYGFEKINHPIKTEKGIWQIWERNLIWKVDSIRIIYHKDLIEIYPTLGIFFDLNNTGQRIGLDGRSVSYCIDRNRTTYLIPNKGVFGLFKDIRAKGFISSVTNDIEKSLKWYELYDEPHKCLDRMVAGKTNIGRGVSYKKALEHLNNEISMNRKSK